MGGSYSRPDIKSKWHEEYVKNMPNLAGKIVAITGCTTGLGRISAMDLAAKGALVIALNRPSERALKAVADIRAAAASGGNVKHVDCDLQSFASVEAAARSVLDLVTDTGLDVLCCNAGVMALPEAVTKDGYDVQMQTNHLSHFLLASQLMPALERAAALRGEARVVSHSSGARKAPSTPLSADHFAKSSGKLGGPEKRWERYHQSKLANAVFVLALQDRLAARDSKVKALVAVPGLAASNLQASTARHSDGIALNILMKFAQSEEDGALPLLECMTAPLEGGTMVTPSKRGALGMMVGDGVSGPPIVKPFEPICSSEDAKTLLWTASEAAVGPFFK